MKSFGIILPLSLARSITAISLKSGNDEIKESDKITIQNELDDVSDTFHVSSSFVHEVYLRGSENGISASNQDQVSQFTPRDEAWLESHNTLRKKYHESYGVTYAPLKWSSELQLDAKNWAEALLDECKARIEPGYQYGSNVGVDAGTGEYPPTDTILHRLESKLDKGYPKNNAMTQVLWRATEYVGCADATIYQEDQHRWCDVWVCNYARPGNCGMGKYSTWQEPTYADSSPCTPFCPPEGCF